MMNCLPTGLAVSKKILLTGAGFTKDFGGFLASEMWSFIFNSPSLDNHPRIKDILRHDFSYESVYHEVIENPEYDEGEKNAIKEAVKSAYDQLDSHIREYRHRVVNRAANSNSVTDFIQRFHGGSNSRSFFFTLNQDLFVERYCRDNGIVTPGVTLQGNVRQDYVLTDYDFQNLPDDNQVTQFFNETNPLRSSQLYYVKLHGSYYWRDSGGDAKMVIGKRKFDQIFQEPLLRYYSELFQEVLSTENVKLFVIGYGFGDEHINKVIDDSIRNHGLDLHIMNPDAPGTFQEILTGRPHCEILWDNLKAYYPYSISRVFPQNGETMVCKQIMNNFFQ